MSPVPALIVDCRNTLGEGVVWSAEEQALFWLDIEEAELWRYDPATGARRTWVLPERAGSFAFRRNGELIMAFASGFAFYHLASGRRTPIAVVEPDLPTRFNDGRCDRQGRFIAGTMDESGEEQPIASVYRVGRDLAVTRIIDGVRISNGLAFSPDGRTMYFADTPQRVIRAYDYDPRNGRLSNGRIFHRLADGTGLPDGSTVDAEGCLWNARWQGHRVVRHRPDGTVDRVIELPVPNVTCVALGGPDLDTLYITTARQGMSDAALKAAPSAGGLFAVPAGVRGLPEPVFQG